MKTDRTAIRPARHGKARSGEQIILDGLGVGPGVAVGVAHLHDGGHIRAPEYRIAATAVESEKKRFEQAVATAGKQMSRLRSKAGRLPAAASEELGYLIDAYEQMLRGSRLIRGVEQRIEKDRLNAEAAVREEIAELIDAFAAMDDAYLAARLADIRELGNRLIRNLTKTPWQPFANLPRHAVIIGQELTPADTALLDPGEVAGFATVTGGAESHTAIMARSLSLPAVINVPNLTHYVRSGDVVIVDGVAGRVIVNPEPETLADYRRRRADFLRIRRSLTRLKDVPAVTTEGERIRLLANIELPNEVNAVRAAGAEGIGLLRSEFLYMNRRDWPSEEEQFHIFRQVVERMDGHPVTIRTLDAGGEKLDTAQGGPPPLNPALGLRAVRFLLGHPDILEAQISGILRASAYGPVRILIPMVTTVDEVVAVRAVVNRVYESLRLARVDVAEECPPVGVMIEVPGAALAADALAQVSDFFAIGTNDLTQYTLAIDRTDETVAHLFNPLHPAVLRLIHFTTAAAMKARIPLSICGEMAGDPRLSGLLIGLGIRELSMSASNIPRVKQRIRKTALAAAEKHAAHVMSEHDTNVISRLIEEFC